MSDNNKENKRKITSEVDELDDFSGFRKSDTVTDSEPEQAQNNSVSESRKRVAPMVRKIVCAAAAVVVLLAVAFGVYGAFVPQNIILGGINVGGIDIGGMKKEEALLSLDKANPFVKSEVVINANGKRFVVKTDDIDAVLDAEATVKKAYNIAKSGNIFANALDSLKMKLAGGEILPVITFNEEKFASKINEIGVDAVGSQLIEHSVRFDEDGKAFIVPGTSGYNNDPTSVMAMIKEALLKSESNEIVVEFEKTKPQKMTVDMLDSYVYKNPVNASFALENGEVKVVEAEPGRYIDKDECKSLVAKVSEDGPEIEIPYKTTEPEVKSDDVKGKLFNGELGSYTTRYAPGGNRGTNVAVAASKINGKILLPGETFSFNGTVGKRTVANGFKPAPEYQNGQTVTGIGGGTCQVSTTVYSAALYADLKIVKRSNHSMSVSYVPLGQDATVTDGGIDLKFMNDTKFPVKISAVTGGGKITVTIIGTTPDEPKTVKISHKSAGGGIRTTRLVYDSTGNLIKEEDMGISKYKPHSENNENTTPSTTPAVTQAPTESTGDESTQTPSVQTPEASATQAPVATQPVVEQPTETKSPVTEAPTVPASSSENASQGSTPIKSEE
ncbi:MAG: VanW family protein [Clostridia bacterium]|nr:VanW family protein [Clostridia bacterium]